jgi:hypothetical protein
MNPNNLLENEFNMNSNIVLQTPSLSFVSWLRQDEENRLLIRLSLIIDLISFSWLKIIYPYPNFMPPDSKSYLEAASNNQIINMWAIGYSQFLRLVSCFTDSHFVLVSLQYLFLQLSLLYFLFSIRYIIRPNKWAFRIIITGCIANPLYVHISNFVSSDAIFTALSFLWFAQLLWILYQPCKTVILIHAVTLLLAFMIRYNALYYPFISTIVILLSKANKTQKIWGIGLVTIFIGAFVTRTLNQYNIVTGTPQFSAFGGWQLASNALYGYAHAEIEQSENVPIHFRRLHKLVNQHMDSIKLLSKRPDSEVAIYYLWDFKSPLKVYMNNQWSKDNQANYFKRWASMAPLYRSYGSYLIKNHPIPFVKHYVWPNLIKYYVPPVGFLGSYNMGQDSAEPIAVTWFKWKDSFLPTYYKNKRISIMQYFSIANGVINLAFILSLIAFLLLSGFDKTNRYTKLIFFLTFIIWTCNMIFSVLAAPIELRYQLFPMGISFIFLVLLTTYIIEKCRFVNPDRTGIRPEFNESFLKS